MNCNIKNQSTNDQDQLNFAEREEREMGGGKKERDRWREGETETERKRDRQTDRQTDGQTELETKQLALNCHSTDD